MGCDTDVVDIRDNPPIYGRGLLPDIPVRNNSGESLDDASTISAVVVSAATEPPSATCHPFDVLDHTSQASAVYTIEYMV